MLNKKSMFNQVMGILEEEEYDAIEYFTDGDRQFALVFSGVKSVLVLEKGCLVEVYYKGEFDFDLYEAESIEVYDRLGSMVADIVRFLD